MIGLILFVLLIASPAWGAAAFDAATPEGGEGVTGISFSHTTSGANRLLSVCSATILGNDITGVTYNGVSANAKATAITGQPRVELFELVSPTVGAQTVSISYGGTETVAAIAMSFTGVDQITPSGTAVTAVDFSDPVSNNVTVPADGMAYDCFLVAGTGHTVTVGAGQTEQADIDVATNLQLRTSTSTDAGVNAMGWTWTPDDNYDAHLAVPLNAAGATATLLRRKPVVTE